MACVFFCLFSGRDGSMPVSFIQKYLVRKLDLMSDDEVQPSSFAYSFFGFLLVIMCGLN